jgi:DNA polymerase (family 10)
VREHAARKNLRVSENGILNLESGDVVTSRDEQGVYAALGMQYIPPELRSGIGEVELALRNEVPELLELSDVRGDFHMHSTWSDGRQTLEEMIAASAARGYEYHAITDHSPARGVIGCSAEELRSQHATIRELGDKYGIHTLWGSEVDILPDGSMDFPDDLLAEMDVVIASVHSSFRQTREEMTARLIRACENPYVTIIGHPTGRKIEGFEGYEYDFEAVFAAAARTGTALEIDGQPKRFDLPANLARRAKTLGATITVDSDAHDVSQLANIDLAIGQARRAGLTREDILNARPLAGVLEFVRSKRARAKP